MPLAGPRAAFRHSRLLPRRPGLPRRKTCFDLESLESRRLLSVSAADVVGPVVTPSVAETVVTPSRFRGGYFPWGGGGITNPNPVSGALTPAQIASAYDLNLSASAGAGQTIAIVTAYNDPNIASDLATFSSTYGLPAASLTVVNQYGSTTNLPATDGDWSLEAAMDVEWAHAAAPGAKLVLVEANSASVSDMMTAVSTAAKLANVVSMSWGGSEFAGETAYDKVFANSKVTFVSASGDSGGYGGAQWPSSSPYVVSVGGTTLNPGSAETAWSGTNSWYSGASGSGGGLSQYESTPSYQSGLKVARRSTPDVSAVGNPSTGVSVYSTVPSGGQTGWFKVGGTSAATPIWAGVVARIDQARGASLNSTQTLSLLYSLGSNATTYASAFHDVTSGSNAAGAAVKGYDKVTGLGTPDVAKLVALASGVSLSSVKSAAASSASAASGSTVSKAAIVEFVNVSTTSSAVLTNDPLLLGPVPGSTTTTTTNSTTPTTTTAASRQLLAPSQAGQARPTQSLVAQSRPGRLSFDDSVLRTSKSDWTREPDLYIEPGEPSLVPTGAEELLASGVVGSLNGVSPAVVDAAHAAIDDDLGDDPGLDPTHLINPAEAPPALGVETPETSPALAFGAAVVAWGVWQLRQKERDRAASVSRERFRAEALWN
ncbi:MAG: S53 family peptidase [Isosphaeraceae bacterium]